MLFRSDKPCVIALVPFSNAAGVRIYKQRILDSMDRSFGDLGADQLNAFDFSVGGEHGFARLRWLVKGDPKDSHQGGAPDKIRRPKKARE